MNPWLQATNILAIRLDNTGDVIMLGPALRAVIESSPDARLTLLASPAGAKAAPLLPWVDEVIEWRPVWQDIGGRMPLDPDRERQLLARIAAGSYDAALIFTSFSQTPYVPGYLCYLAGIPLRAGESKEFGGSTLTNELTGTLDSLHQTERNLRLVESLGFRVVDRSLGVGITNHDRDIAVDLLRGAGIDPDEPFVLLHPGATATARRYSPQRSGMVARSLTEHGWQVLITGIGREQDVVEEVLDGAPRAASLIGNATLPQYAALIERAHLVICGNTLPMHLADATDTPVVTLYSGTELESQWKPRYTPNVLLRRETACSPCYLFDCPIGQPCLDIPPEEVVDAVEWLACRRSNRTNRRSIRSEVIND